jgi:MFS family permease
MSDLLGRRNTYFVFFALGTALDTALPYTGAIGSVTLFVVAYGIIFSMYGGGFATVPADLCDMFGTRYVGAIHGLLLTAWSMGGIFGPVLVNYIREYNLAHGVAKAQAYNLTMYVMAVLLVDRHHMTGRSRGAGLVRSRSCKQATRDRRMPTG